MIGKISTLHNTKGEVAFPITTANAVYMDDGSTKLNDKIEDIETSLDNIMSGRKEFFVSDFGAIGDGVNDDTNSIIKAIEQCQMYKGSTLIFPYGFVCRTTETIQIPININVIMNGYSKILYDGNECALKIGEDTKANGLVKLRLNVEKQNTSNFSDDSVGVKIINLRESEVDIPFIDGFETNILFESNMLFGGTAWNNIKLGVVKRFKKGLVFVSKSNGWTNANVITGGSFTRLSNLNPTITSTGIVIESPDGTYKGNNSNNFYNCMFESGGDLFLPIEISGIDNKFNNCRFEAVSNKYLMLVNFGYGNKILNAHVQTSSRKIASLGYDSTNFIEPREQLIISKNINDIITSSSSSSIEIKDLYFYDYNKGRVRTSSCFKKVENGLELTNTYPATGLGCRINTKLVKKFKLNCDCTGTSRLVVICYDSDKNNIGANDRVIEVGDGYGINMYARYTDAVKFTTGVFSANMKSYTQPNNSVDGIEAYFEVAPEVCYCDVILYPNNVGSIATSYNVYSVNELSSNIIPSYI